MTGATTRARATTRMCMDGLLEPEGFYPPSLAWSPASYGAASPGHLATPADSPEERDVGEGTRVPRLLRFPSHDHEPPSGPLFLLVYDLEPGGAQVLPDGLGLDAVAVRSAIAARRKVDDGDASAGLERTI